MYVGFFLIFRSNIVKLTCVHPPAKAIFKTFNAWISKIRYASVIILLREGRKKNINSHIIANIVLMTAVAKLAQKGNVYH